MFNKILCDSRSRALHLFEGVQPRRLAYYATMRGDNQTKVNARDHSLAEAHQQHQYGIWYCTAYRFRIAQKR